MKKLTFILFTLILSSCVKERIFEDSEPEEKLSPYFTPTTTPIHVLAATGYINECFYENNNVKLIAYNPNNTRYDWYLIQEDGTEELISHDSILITNQTGEFKLEFEREVFDVGEIDSTIYINLSHCTTGLDIPETIIPNNPGGLYNTWLPIFTGVSEFYVRISDQDGNTIFESESELNRFDGTYLGTPLPSGSYHYYVSGMYRSGYNFEQQGVIELIN